MDLSKSPLNKFITKSQLKPVTKAFHGTYLYRVECHVYGAWFLRSIKKNWQLSDLANFVVERQQVEAAMIRERASGPTKWDLKRMADLMGVDPATVWACHESRHEHKSRVERNIFSLYFSTEQEVVDMLTKYPLLAKKVYHIFAPSSDSVAEQLKDNVVFQRNPTHKYKVDIREGQYDLALKQQLQSYISNFPKDFRIPSGLKARLENNHSTFLYGHYFANDIGILSFVKLIAPSFVRKIYRVEQLL